MKTAEEAWNEVVKRLGRGFIWSGVHADWRQEMTLFREILLADALAEKPAAPDADEEREKREYAEYALCHPRWPHVISWEQLDDVGRQQWRAYVKTLPPRPMRSPGQRLFESERDCGAWGADEDFSGLSEMTRTRFETRATALGIQPQE